MANYRGCGVTVAATHHDQRHAARLGGSRDAHLLGMEQVERLRDALVKP
jgi:hypothetical protein